MTPAAASDVGLDGRGGARADASSGLVHFFSRSRQKLWQKGETSGTRCTSSRFADCDDDAVLVRVSAEGGVSRRTRRASLRVVAKDLQRDSGRTRGSYVWNYCVTAGRVARKWEKRRSNWWSPVDEDDHRVSKRRPTCGFTPRTATKSGLDPALVKTTPPPRVELSSREENRVAVDVGLSGSDASVQGEVEPVTERNRTVHLGPEGK